MSRRQSSLQFLIRQYWPVFCEGTLLVAVALSFISLLWKVVPGMLPGYIYAISFVGWIASEKIEGRPLSLEYKALSYFGLYAVAFYLIEYWLSKTPWLMAASVVPIALSLMLVPLIIFQMKNLISQAQGRSATREILLYGIIAISSMAFVAFVHLMKIFFKKQ